MQDVAKAKRNVARMVSGGASEQEIDSYLSSQGLSDKELRGVPNTSIADNFMNPINSSVNNVKTKWGKMLGDKTGRERGPSLGDLAGVPMSVLQGTTDVVSRPISQALVNSGLPIYDTKLSTLLKSNPLTYRPRQIKGQEAEDALNSDIGTALSSSMPGRGIVGRVGPQIPQGLRLAKATTPEAKAIKRLVQGQKLGDAQKKAQAFNDAGVDPTIIDVLDDTAKARVMAAASRPTPSRDLVKKAADSARVDMGGRVSKQVERTISSNPRELDDVVNELENAQSTDARVNYAEPYKTPVQLNDRVLGALGSEEGTRAINEALKVARERPEGDPASTGLASIERALQKQQTVQVPTHRAGSVDWTPPEVPIPTPASPDPFYGNLSSRQVNTQPLGPEAPTVRSPSVSTRSVNIPTQDGGLHGLAEPQLPSVPASVLDRIQIAMRQRAKNLLKGENASPALAGTVLSRRKIVNGILDDVDGLKEARGVYANQQRQIDAVEAAPNALKPGHGAEITEATQGLDDATLAPGRDVLAREMQRRLGERIGSAPSVAESFLATEPQQRIAAYAGQDRTKALSQGVQVELDRLRNLQQVAPGAGLKAIGQQDQDLKLAHDVGDVARAGLAVSFGGKFQAAFLAMKIWARNAGMSNKEAEMIARMSIDPTQTSKVFKALRNKYGPVKAAKLTATAKAIAAQNLADKVDDQ